ncbi:hypothetical protein E2562_015249 [Oryza meyeriana var. granulata]|uniref:Uncharacterized protein n=1 Tax=Oryza meyeriana var. granulata TaxID=110450 RepID=A0A6G1DK09_9ORYZ|nr:hypothetical protein E2562_015249 [Oryza meyeriana var. granulata]
MTRPKQREEEETLIYLHSTDTSGKRATVPGTLAEVSSVVGEAGCIHGDAAKTPMAGRLAPSASVEQWALGRDGPSTDY